MKSQTGATLFHQMTATILCFAGVLCAGKPGTGFRPDEIMISGHVGMTGSRLESNGEMKYFFDPIGKARPLVAANYGVSTEFRWNRILVSLGLWRERVGQFTPNTRVAFQGNSFPQEFETETWANQFVIPVQTGFGLAGRRHRFFVKTGIYGALLSERQMAWKVEGVKYTGAPEPWLYEGDKGWLLGVEYGMRLGRGTVLLSLGSRRSFSTIVTSLDGGIANGTARVASGRVSLGYGYSFR